MSQKNMVRAASVGIIVAALIGATASVAQAAEPVPPTVGSTGNYFLVSSETGAPIPAGTTLHWNDDVSGSPVADNQQFDQMFTGPADATSVVTFISPRGSERNPSAYGAYLNSTFNGDSKNVLLPAGLLSSQVLGPIGANGIKAAGGNYSLGLAFLKNNGLTVASDTVYYTYITITAGTGDWTFATPTVTEPQPEASGAFDENLQATTLAAADGTLNLVAPANATAVIGNPAIDPVTHLSTSTGKLGEFSVQDGRVVTHPGWSLTTSVTDFTNSADSSVKIDKKQLGIAPALVSSPAGSAVTTAAAQVAGSATNPAQFASASDSATVGTSVFNADLTFVAPADKPAGTYTSKLTVTLTSK